MKARKLARSIRKRLAWNGIALRNGEIARALASVADGRSQSR
jgi:hypothetical protein